MSLLTPMVLMEQFFDEGLESVHLDISTDDNVGNFGIALVDCSLIG